MSDWNSCGACGCHARLTDGLCADCRTMAKMQELEAENADFKARLAVVRETYGEGMYEDREAIERALNLRLRNWRRP